MEKQSDPASTIRGLVKWAMTPPQSVAVYLVCLCLVAGMSYFAGTMKPKHAAGPGPAPVSVPRN
jgi:hypothetical protein